MTGWKASEVVFQGLRYELSYARVALQRTHRRVASGLARLNLGTWDDPPVAHRADWIALRPLLSGICGSDLGLLTGRLSPYLFGWSSTPFVPGHEMVAMVDTSGGPLPQGTRVVVDPSLACAPRSLPLCPACQAGLPERCQNRHQGSLAAGLLVGYCAEAPGGWATRTWAPRSQLYVVPKSLPDVRAVLAEPTAIVLHGLRQLASDAAHGPLLVLGGGTIGQLTVAAARWLRPDWEVVAATRYPFQARMAGELGAHAVVAAETEALIAYVVDHLGGERLARPPGLPSIPNLTTGFSVVVDAVGSPSSLQAALTLLAPGGTLLLLGALGTVRQVDMTPIWAKELRVVGAYGYGEQVGGHDFPLALAMLTEAPGPLEQLVTQQFSLTQWQAAINAAMHHRNSGSFKVAFAIPPADSPRLR